MARRITLAAALGSLLCLLLLTSCDGPSPATPALPIDAASLQGFDRVGFHRRRISTFHTLERGAEVLKVHVVHNIDRDSARTLREDGIMALEALYASALSAYPGDISKRIEIGERFRPRFFTEERDGAELAYFLLFANERFGYGAGTPEAVRYRSLLGWFYCAADKSFVKVRYFAPRDTGDEELREFFRSLRCSSSR